jgi:serine O-acetyltransferase
MGLEELKNAWYSDLYRYEGQCSKKIFIRYLLVTPGYKYTFIMRLCQYLTKTEKRLIKPVYLFFRVVLRHYTYKYGIGIEPSTNIGNGFYIGHFGSIFISPETVIGKNCNISQNVTIGQASRGRNKGHPTIGDNVYIGPGAKIIGAIHIGSNVAIGANCVVTKDIPDSSVVVGIPGRVISSKGSEGYVNNTI